MGSLNHLYLLNWSCHVSLLLSSYYLKILQYIKIKAHKINNFNSIINVFGNFVLRPQFIFLTATNWVARSWLMAWTLFNWKLLKNFPIALSTRKWRLSVRLLDKYLGTNLLKDYIKPKLSFTHTPLLHPCFICTFS